MSSLQLVGGEVLSWRVKDLVDGSEARVYPCSTIVSPRQRLTFPNINDIISDQRTEREFCPVCFALRSSFCSLILWIKALISQQVCRIRGESYLCLVVRVGLGRTVAMCHR